LLNKILKWCLVLIIGVLLISVGAFELGKIIFIQEELEKPEFYMIIGHLAYQNRTPATGIYVQLWRRVWREGQRVLGADWTDINGEFILYAHVESCYGEDVLVVPKIGNNYHVGLDGTWIHLGNQFTIYIGWIFLEV